MKSLPTLSIGSISSGTLRQEDLIPAYVSAVEDLIDAIATNAPTDLESQQEHVQTSKRLTDMLAAIEKRQEEEGYYDSEAADFDAEELTETLNEFCPQYTYFGSHEGDGADIGVWVSWDSLEDDARFGEVLKIDDTSEIPADYRGYALHVNDHGNATLYNVTDAGNEEVWAVV